MAITTQDSVQIANGKAFPPKINPASEDGGRVRVKVFTFTQSGQGDAGSLAHLAKLPGGRLRVLQFGYQSAAMGAARTLDFGHGGFSDSDGNVVAADPIAFAAARDVSAAVTEILIPVIELDTPGGFVLTARINGGTLDDGKTLNGYVAYAVD